MEIFRTWGIEDEVRVRGIPHDRNQGIAFVRSLSGDRIGEIRTYGDPAKNRLVETNGPSAKTSCPQDLLEPILERAAEARSEVTVRFGTRLVSMRQDAEGVEAELIDAAGASSQVRARYLVAADGARGGVREMLGVAFDEGRALGQQIGVYFEADLWPWVAQRPNLLWRI